MLDKHNSDQSHTTGKLDIAHCYYYKRFALLLLGTVFSVLYYCLVQWDSAYSNGRVESAQDALGSTKNIVLSSEVRFAIVCHYELLAEQRDDSLNWFTHATQYPMWWWQ